MEDNQDKKEQLKVINGYLFETNQEYIKAKREKQVVDQMKKTMDWKNPEIAYKLYRKILDNNSFTTIIGIHFLWELRTVILRSGTTVDAEQLFVPVKGMELVDMDADDDKKEKHSLSAKSMLGNAQFEKNSIALEKYRNSNKVKNIIIAFLVFIIAGMLVISQITPYSVFTDYETKIINQYEEWEKELEAREAAVTERENALKGQ